MNAYRINIVHASSIFGGYLVLELDPKGIDDPNDPRELLLIDRENKKAIYKDSEWTYVGKPWGYAGHAGQLETAMFFTTNKVES